MGVNNRDQNQIFSHIFTLQEKCKYEYTIFIKHSKNSKKERISKDAVIAVGWIIDKNLLKELEAINQSRLH